MIAVVRGSSCRARYTRLSDIAALAFKSLSDRAALILSITLGPATRCPGDARNAQSSGRAAGARNTAACVIASRRETPEAKHSSTNFCAIGSNLRTPGGMIFAKLRTCPDPRRAAHRTLLEGHCHCTSGAQRCPITASRVGRINHLVSQRAAVGASRRGTGQVSGARQE